MKLYHCLSISQWFIYFILAASVPYTIGVHLDDIETHGANTDATTSEQVVAPGVYVYGDEN